MQSDIRITVVGRQEDQEAIEIKTMGTYYSNIDSEFQTIIIKYCQEEENGSKTYNKILLSDDNLILKKSGEIESEMNFQIGKVTYCALKLDVMTLEMKVDTKHFALSKEEDSLRIKLIYDLYISESEAVENHLDILVEAI